MKRTAFYYWMIPDPLRGGRLRRTRWQMTEDQAATIAGAVRVDTGVTWRDLPETPDEAMSLCLSSYQGNPGKTGPQQG
jgi:hypothetical protein